MINDCLLNFVFFFFVSDFFVFSSAEEDKVDKKIFKACWRTKQFLQFFFNFKLRHDKNIRESAKNLTSVYKKLSQSFLTNRRFSSDRESRWEIWHYSTVCKHQKICKWYVHLTTWNSFPSSLICFLWASFNCFPSYSFCLWKSQKTFLPLVWSYIFHATLKLKRVKNQFPFDGEVK